jgi:hypothetical protein
MTQVKEKKLTDAELDKKEYAQFEQEYNDWCKKYSINYVIEQEEKDENV